MKKIVICSVAAAVLLGTMPAVFAQTSTSSISQLQALIETLKQQIADLQAKIVIQQQATANVQQAQQAAKGTLSLIRQLKQGMSGDDVKALQAALAADPTVFPEGKITGFFGRLTAEAVKRFQKKHDLEQVGDVGPKTLKELNKDLEDNQLSEEENDNNENNNDEDENHNGERGRHLCAIVPPGHLIAPGWLRKHHDDDEEDRPIVPPCQTLPPGIINQLPTSTMPTSTDTTAPMISAVSVISVSSNSATITWSTNEFSDSTVWYTTSTPVQTTSTTPTVNSAALVTYHSVTLSGLAPASNYHYVVASKDASGNQTFSGEFSFLTPAAPDTTAPIVSGISATNVSSSSAHVVWSTNEPATSKVWYGTVSPVQATGTTPMISSADLVSNHNMLLSSLNATTTYYFVVESSDASGNKALGSESSFMTTQ